jgi:glutathione synthase/RimK-type ligase-like ATP-grasp enzyme
VTVLLWGRADDPVLDAVARACEVRGIDPVIVDGDDLKSVEIDGGLVTRDGRELALDAVTGVLVRPDGRVTTAESIVAVQSLNAWTELTDAVVLNRPSASASNRSKPYQLGLIAEAGFAVPDTLVTTDPDDVRAFCAEHDRVVYKSVSGVRSIVRMLGREHWSRLRDVTTCPTQFQEFVPGIDYRVHVVGQDVYTCQIESGATDYRYAALSGLATTVEVADLPDPEAERCVTLARSLGVALAGIDLRLDPSGAWWCFEVNTAPGFIWFEQHTGLPIAAAVASVLGGSARLPSTR